jgi:hypothetical protein
MIKVTEHHSINATIKGEIKTAKAIESRDVEPKEIVSDKFDVVDLIFDPSPKVIDQVLSGERYVLIRLDVSTYDTPYTSCIEVIGFDVDDPIVVVMF